MSCRELIESLRRAGDEKVRNVWQEAEAEAAKVRAGVLARLDRIRSEHAGLQASRVQEAQAGALNEANARARTVRLSLEQALSERLYAAARDQLQRMRNDGYPVVFERLVRELPVLDWQIVRVHPADVALAKNYFKQAEIVADNSISGGVDAATAAGSIRVVNTFEKRLERSWVDLLPSLIREVYQEVSDGTPAAS